MRGSGSCAHRTERDGPPGCVSSGARVTSSRCCPVGGDAIGVTTDGLAYPLVDEPLVVGRTRGLSNERTRDEASVHLRRGRLLVIETPATLSG